MAIIYLTVSSRQRWRGQTDRPLVCPRDSSHHLVKNGHYTRHADSLPPDAALVIQRYYCRSCATTYSALPYDLRPYSTASWGVTLAAGAVWRLEHRWTWTRCQQWLAAHGLPYHLRTLQRWHRRWQTAVPAVVQAAVQWIAQVEGTRTIAVFPGYAEAPLSHWRRLWRAVRDHHAADPAVGYGGWLAGSVLWGWLSITDFAGLSPG